MQAREVVAEVLSYVISRQGPAPSIMKTVKVLKERKIADRFICMGMTALGAQLPSRFTAEGSPIPQFSRLGDYS